MELYAAKIQLGGSRENEVRRGDLTAAEVYILKQVHGAEFVSEIRLVGEVKRTQSEERVRLLGSGEVPGIYSLKNIRAVFPSDLTPLPEAVPVEWLNVAAMAEDLKPAADAKPVEEMTTEEMDAELALLETRRKNMAKARAAKAKAAGSAPVLD